MNINRVKEQLGEAVSSLYKAVGDCESFPYNRNAYIKDAKRCIDRALGELQKTDWVSVNEELPEYGEKVVVRNDYYKSDEPWVTFRDIRDLFPKDSNDFREVAGTTSCGITHWKHI